MARSGTSFKPGTSGNPNGRKPFTRAELEEALAKIGKTTTGVTKDLIEMATIWLLDPDASDRIRTYAHDFLARYVMGLPTQVHEVSGGLTPEQQALWEAFKMTPHERRLARPAAQDTTADEDSAAMAALEHAGDND